MQEEERMRQEKIESAHLATHPHGKDTNKRKKTNKDKVIADAGTSLVNANVVEPQQP